MRQCERAAAVRDAGQVPPGNQAPQELPLPQGYGSFLPTFSLVMGAVVSRIMAARFDISLSGSSAPPMLT